MASENDEVRKMFKDLDINDQACETSGCKNPSKIQAEAIPHALEGKKDLVGLSQTDSVLFFPTRELAIQIAGQGQFEAASGSSVGGGGGGGVKCAVDLDEADRLLDDDSEKTIDETLKAIPKERSSHLFSATMTKKIVAASKYSTVDTLMQQCCLIPAKHKDCYLVFILTEKPHTTSVVFTCTCETTRILALLLRNLGLRAIPISGQMSQAKRLGALNKFKAGECNILICTDVASRGLHIPSVDMVINYDIPTNYKDYIHRVGRTAARAGRSGFAISLVNQYEVERYYQIEKLVGKEILLFEPQREEVLLLLERVSVAKRLSLMKLKVSGGGRKRRGEDQHDRARQRNHLTQRRLRRTSDDNHVDQSTNECFGNID